MTILSSVTQWLITNTRAITQIEVSFLHHDNPLHRGSFLSGLTQLK
jgi:hypothetical protein